MTFVTEPGRLSERVELIDVVGWRTPKTTGVLLVQGKDYAVIEAGHHSSGLHLLEELDRRNIPRNRVAYVLVTHRHADHCGGATPLAEGLPQATVAGHKYALATLRSPERINQGARQLFGSHAEDIRPLPPEISTQELNDGDTIELGGGVEIEVVATPGHTSDHLAYYEPESRTLYTGDAAGLLGPESHTTPPTSFPPSFKYARYRDSLERLRSYDPKILVFSHFGAATGSDAPRTLERALETLEAWKEAAEEAWKEKNTYSAVASAIRDRFTQQLEVFPPEARPIIIQVMAIGLARSLFPEEK